jgi:hypothetical protein
MLSNSSMLYVHIETCFLIVALTKILVDGCEEKSVWILRPWMKPPTNGVGKGIGVLHCTLHGGRTVLRLQSRGQWCYQDRALVSEVL